MKSDKILVKQCGKKAEDTWGRASHLWWNQGQQWLQENEWACPNHISRKAWSWATNTGKLLFNKRVQMLLPLCFVWGSGQENVLCTCLQRWRLWRALGAVTFFWTGSSFSFECVVSTVSPLAHLLPFKPHRHLTSLIFFFCCCCSLHSESFCYFPF